MKKTLMIMLAVLMMVAVFAACAPPAADTGDDTTDDMTDDTATDDTATDDTATDDTATDDTATDDTATDDTATDDTGAELAMITDAGEIDDKSFNQSTWEGIVDYANENGKTYKYYKPLEISDDAYLASIDLAIEGGAKVIVTPGFLFGTAVFKAQDLYPDTSFIIIDVQPNNGLFGDEEVVKVADNTYSIIFAEEQVGFLAGVAAVKDGYTKIGYMGGMAVPAVVKYGIGFVQGAEYAAKEMGLDSVDLKYYYTGDFADTPENQTMAASWFSSGTEVIFGAGGKVGNSVFAAAEAAGAKSIGVDVDQSAESDSIITSAKKGLAQAVKDALADFDAGTFKGGVTDIYDLTVPGGLGLEMGNSKFESFTQADYDALVAALIADTDGVTSGISNDFVAYEDPTNIPTTVVKVTYVK